MRCSIGIWSMAARVIVAEQDDLVARVVGDRARRRASRGGGLHDWAAEPKLPARAARAEAAVRSRSAWRGVSSVVSSRMSGIAREILHKIRALLTE